MGLHEARSVLHIYKIRTILLIVHKYMLQSLLQNIKITMVNKISALLITLNEEEHIENVVENLIKY